MELTPTRLVAICAALFGGIVAINVIAQARERGDIKERLSSISDLGAFSSRLRREEMMEAPEIDEPALVDRLMEVSNGDEPASD